MAEAQPAIQLWLSIEEAEKIFAKTKDDKSMDSVSAPLNAAIAEWYKK